MNLQRHETSGDILRKAREAAKMNHRDISKHLHLSESTIKAIEQNRFDMFTDEIYTRGHLRRYAKILHISETEVISAYESWHEEQNKKNVQKSPKLPEIETNTQTAKRSRLIDWFSRRYLSILAGMILLLLVSGLILLAQKTNAQTPIHAVTIDCYALIIQ